MLSVCFLHWTHICVSCMSVTGCQFCYISSHKKKIIQVKIMHCYIPSIAAKNRAVLQACNATYSQNTSPQNMYTILIWIICRGLGSCGVLLHSLHIKTSSFWLKELQYFHTLFSLFPNERLNWDGMIWNGVVAPSIQIQCLKKQFKHQSILFPTSLFFKWICLSLYSKHQAFSSNLRRCIIIVQRLITIICSNIYNQCWVVTDVIWIT